MLAKNATRLSTLRMLKSNIGYTQMEKKTENLSDAEVLVVIQKEVKKRRDSIEQYEAGGRPELAAKEKEELDILATFLPKSLTPEELETIVRDSIAESGATSKKEMGAVMKLAQAKVAGRAEGRAISTLVNKLLP